MNHRVFLTILLLLFVLFLPFPVMAQINSNPQGSFEVEVGGTVSSQSATQQQQQVTNQIAVTISGFASPNASIILLSSTQETVASTTADAEGNFTITAIMLPAEAAEYCFRVVDFKRLGESESCMSINPSTLSTISDIYLPPTIGVERAEISEGQEAVIYGYTMPNATVHLKLSTGEIVEITADETGYYEYRNNALEAGDYSFVASASYDDTDSLEPKNSAFLKKLSAEQVALKAREALKEVTKSDGGFPWWILIVPFLLALIGGLVWFVKKHPELLNRFAPFLIPMMHKLFPQKALHHDKIIKQVEKESRV